MEGNNFNQQNQLQNQINNVVQNVGQNLNNNNNNFNLQNPLNSITSSVEQTNNNEEEINTTSVNNNINQINFQENLNNNNLNSDIEKNLSDEDRFLFYGLEGGYKDKWYKEIDYYNMRSDLENKIKKIDKDFCDKLGSLQEGLMDDVIDIYNILAVKYGPDLSFLEHANANDFFNSINYARDYQSAEDITNIIYKKISNVMLDATFDIKALMLEDCGVHIRRQLLKRIYDLCFEKHKNAIKPYEDEVLNKYRRIEAVISNYIKDILKSNYNKDEIRREMHDLLTYINKVIEETPTLTADFFRAIDDEMNLYKNNAYHDIYASYASGNINNETYNIINDTDDEDDGIK